MILKLIPLVPAIILSGCASHTIVVHPMPPEATSMDGAIIAAIGDYVRYGNLDRWPGISGYDSNPIFTTMSAGPITEETLINALYWAEKTLWDKHRYISPFLPVYFNQASNALLAAWTGPSGGGTMALFTLRQQSNRWTVVKGEEIRFFD